QKTYRTGTLGLVGSTTRQRAAKIMIATTMSPPPARTNPTRTAAKAAIVCDKLMRVRPSQIMPAVTSRPTTVRKFNILRGPRSGGAVMRSIHATGWERLQDCRPATYEDPQATEHAVPHQSPVARA